MRKLKLDLGQIQVTTFATKATEGDRGTVQGFSAVFTWPTCNEYQTCEGYICPNIDVPETQRCNP